MLKKQVKNCTCFSEIDKAAGDINLTDFSDKLQD